MKNTLLLIDTFNLFHRAYYALPRTLSTKDGTPTNAVYGVARMLLSTLDLVKPNYVVAAFESKEKTLRAKEFEDYKATRKPMDDDLKVQIPILKEVLNAFGVYMLSFSGYEADDVMATLAIKYKSECKVVISSNDRDLWQLLDDGVDILLPNTKGKPEWASLKDAQDHYGFEVDLIADYKALRGDPSDNIPGVAGIGKVTATKLVKKWGTIENIYSNIENIEKESVRKKLIDSKENAILSKRLATLECDLPVNFDIKEASYFGSDPVIIARVLGKYNFKSLVKQLGVGDGGSNLQGGLFS